MLPPKKKKKKALKTNNSQSKKNGVSSFQFHNHLTTDAGVDTRSKKSSKSATIVRRALVPNSPLLSRRFYDWPPNPSVSTVDIYTPPKMSSETPVDPL